ncbi:MAG: flavin reductase family protein, partial [Catalinimonas sp.]
MPAFQTLDPAAATTSEVYSLLIGAVVPRPIAFASTIDAEGRPNLSPYSFFNAMGSTPPTLVFSPARRGRDHTTKDTLDNLRAHGEVVISVVTYPMVEQMSLTSAEFPKGVSEFEKGGFTAVPSERVRPPRVGESPVSFECRVD